jgi:hypothetical protein
MTKIGTNVRIITDHDTDRKGQVGTVASVYGGSDGLILGIMFEDGDVSYFFSSEVEKVK